MFDLKSVRGYPRGMATAWKKPSDTADAAGWTFLTNHGHVLVCIAQNPDVRIAEIARLVGIGERAAHRIVSDLADGGYVTVRKEGRRNTYKVDYSRKLRHPLESQHSIGEIFRALAKLRSER
jgi:DNA-binding IclR family transcriptional regulator